MINRREFIKRAGVLVAAIATNTGDLLRGETPATLANSSAAWYNVENSQESKYVEFSSLDIDCDCFRIAQSLDDGESVAARLDEFGQMCAAQKPELAEIPMPQGQGVRRRMASLLTDNPEMSREDAFLQAVFEKTEGSL